MKIHSNLGPVLLESVYQKCLIHELKKLNIKCTTEVPVPIQYDSMTFETGFRADLLADNKVIVEIKSVQTLLPIHKAQTLTYLKLSQRPLALLINFGEASLKNGIHRFANGKEAENL